jgi:hypothetical protein
MGNKGLDKEYAGANHGIAAMQHAIFAEKVLKSVRRFGAGLPHAWLNTQTGKNQYYGALRAALGAVCGVLCKRVFV